MAGCTRATKAVRQYLQASLASNTVKAYVSDLKRFKAWGGTVPATPDEVARYLAAAAAELKPSTLARQLAAICYAHEIRGLVSPTKSALVRRTLKGIRRAKGVAQKQAAPIAPALLRRVVRPLRCLSAAQNQRDAALFLLAFAGGFRRSEISGLQVGDVEFTPRGVLVQLRRSKTDQVQRGREVAIPRSPDAAQCPVRALRRWLTTLSSLPSRGRGSSPTSSLFCRIDRYGYACGALSGASVGWLLRKRLALHALPTDGYSAHSLRAGLVTSAFKAGAPIWAIQRQTGQRSESTVHRYIRGLSAFECNAAARVL